MIAVYSYIESTSNSCQNRKWASLEVEGVVEDVVGVDQEEEVLLGAKHCISYSLWESGFFSCVIK